MRFVCLPTFSENEPKNSRSDLVWHLLGPFDLPLVTEDKDFPLLLLEKAWRVGFYDVLSGLAVNRDIS